VPVSGNLQPRPCLALKEAVESYKAVRQGLLHMLMHSTSGPPPAPRPLHLAQAAAGPGSMRRGAPKIKVSKLHYSFASEETVSARGALHGRVNTRTRLQRTVFSRGWVESIHSV
jgi:hypothetical protein